ncbi:MAG: winged helix-turn-helix domain-containing protein [Paludibacteraceae bacterium]|jgi:molybdate transport system regulatory protein|nr:winged helix-turn-helix domain-containing protein [Paludibacteraceae bacterium]
MTSKNGYNVDGAFLINKGDEIFFGPTQYKLLRQIIKDGSINAAAKNLAMSYQHAWTVIDKMNKMSPIPIVIRQKGGKDGGGCRISEYGMKIYDEFARRERLFKEFLELMNNGLDGCFI